MNIVTAILNTLIVIVCLFLICLILIQRGKGGGLAGAFGGMGGSSAFGSKTGDVFTRVTVIVASVWIFLSMILVVLYNRGNQSAWGNEPAAVSREVLPANRSTAGKDAPAVPAPGGSAPAPPAGATPEKPE